eukprot:354411-Chlamydomonas_euryale.AAC.6
MTRVMTCVMTRCGCTARAHDLHSGSTHGSGCCGTETTHADATNKHTCASAGCTACVECPGGASRRRPGRCARKGGRRVPVSGAHPCVCLRCTVCPKSPAVPVHR